MAQYIIGFIMVAVSTVVDITLGLLDNWTFEVECRRTTGRSLSQASVCECHAAHRGTATSALSDDA
ncbi:hypothetical protein N7463_007503 [Penicillium fimorum]|uniref:Uncharacterized protein n=1 Tax=Penicillium fimorum TaxID=1882269 RepID=A0A9W9XWS6_9EURO|nr:hypothetical protein N7463_007503 [Penicillium fimorum]